LGSGSLVGQRRRKKGKHSMSKRRKLWLTGMLASLMLASLAFSGCSTTTLYPITDKDIYFNADGNVCMTPFYMEEVLKAKLKVKK
jgi:hypothetical protein